MRHALPHHTVLTRHNGKMSWSGQSEYQYVGYDEATQFPLHLYTFLWSRLRRRSNMDVPIRLRAASNPGGIGHESGQTTLFYRGTGVRAGLRRRQTAGQPLARRKRVPPVPRRIGPRAAGPIARGDWSISGTSGNFRREWFETITAEPSEWERLVRYWDTASVAPLPGRESEADWTVGTLMGRLPGAHKFVVLDVVRFQGNAATVEHNVYQTAVADGHTYNDAVEIYMEQEPGASGKIMIEQYRDKVLPQFFFQGIRSTGRTGARGPLFRPMRRPQRAAALGAWISRWLDEHESFPYGPHDDQVDSSSGSYNQLTLGGEVRLARRDVSRMFSWRQS